MTKVEEKKTRSADCADHGGDDDRQTTAKHEAPAGVQSVETEDPHQVGAGRAQQHESLKQNVEGGQGQRHPETPAGQHATGSFTGENSAKKK